MADKDVAKNLLEDKVCGNCVHHQTIENCNRWMGGAVGWQWWTKPEEQTCEDWSKDDAHFTGGDVWVC